MPERVIRYFAYLSSVGIHPLVVVVESLARVEGDLRPSFVQLAILGLRQLDVNIFTGRSSGGRSRNRFSGRSGSTLSGGGGSDICPSPPPNLAGEVDTFVYLAGEEVTFVHLHCQIWRGRY